MQRITIAIDDDLLDVVDSLTERRGYESRSEAFRDIVREAANREAAQTGDAPCIAVLSYVFDYATRELAQKLTRALHEHHDLIAANTRVPLDHASCLELSALRGRVGTIRAFANEIMTQRGVRHANLHIVPVKISADGHRHDPDSPPHIHFEA